MNGIETQQWYVGPVPNPRPDCKHLAVYWDAAEDDKHVIAKVFPELTEDYVAISAEQRANLIAAAPKLLKAAIDIMERWRGGHHVSWEDWDALQAAIAKAKGGSR